MEFITDKQTLEDLNLLGRYNPNSIYNLFKGVRTAGGERLLDHLFHHPLRDAEAINERAGVFRFFQQRGYSFPVEAVRLAGMEDYLGGGGHGNIISTGWNMLRRKLLAIIGIDKEWNLVSEGMKDTMVMLSEWNLFLKLMASGNVPGGYRDRLESMASILEDPRMKWLGDKVLGRDLSLWEMIRYDHLLRDVMSGPLNNLLEGIYEADVFIAVSGVARELGMIYAHALPAARNCLQIAECWHPAIQHAKGNTLELDRGRNVVFLTGANMAGKSTLMKSFGIAVYLAHMGFPVAASAMEFSIRDGIYSSINVTDDLTQGYSHFYAEVLRVKRVAEEVAAGKNLVVIFDELFKGTNVKDAYDGTLAVIEAFSERRNCHFLVSTHITEVGEALRERLGNFHFVFLPTVMEGDVPRYTYRLQEGITSDQHGMRIIVNEGILDIISADN